MTEASLYELLDRDELATAVVWLPSAEAFAALPPELAGTADVTVRFPAAVPRTVDLCLRRTARLHEPGPPARVLPDGALPPGVRLVGGPHGRRDVIGFGRIEDRFG